MSEGLRFLAVDDERPALRDLVRMLKASPAVGRVDSAASGSEALRRLSDSEHDYHALFIDVRMPDLDGVELAQILRQFASPPAIVFVSAYEDAAVQAFELRALDYLVKPVSRQRLAEAVERIGSSSAVEVHEMTGTAAREPDDDEIVPVDSLVAGTTRLVGRSSILYLCASGDYVRVVTEEGRFLMRGSLTDIAERWEPLGFVRVHRRYVVNLRRATEVRPQLNGTATLMFPGGGEVPVARREVAELRRRLGL
ncbi:MAG TPA: LytTR family DNA-binding domain-containing protein [Thermoleophilaceae bacterium]|jgi:DNA-binding LytR/AlgR family response regulator|nr:LytTR family DNA-binding domain-containing protein [Thermoleophilaceae bacterium]